MLKDILDGLKLVAEGIKNVRAIAEAVKDGEAYVRVHHPDVQATLRALLGELERLLGADEVSLTEPHDATETR